MIEVILYSLHYLGLMAIVMLVGEFWDWMSRKLKGKK